VDLELLDRVDWEESVTWLGLPPAQWRDTVGQDLAAVCSPPFTMNDAGLIT